MQHFDTAAQLINRNTILRLQGSQVLHHLLARPGLVGIVGVHRIEQDDGNAGGDAAAHGKFIGEDVRGQGSLFGQHRARIHREDGHLLRLAVIHQPKIFLLEIANRLTLVVMHKYVHLDQAGRRADHHT